MLGRVSRHVRNRYECHSVRDETDGGDGMDEITSEELAANDGHEGRPAWVLYKGKVYDVTESAMWTDGDHEAQHQAGHDLTAEHEDAPHDEYILEFPEVGAFVEG